MIENIYNTNFFIQHYSILWLHLIDFLCRKQIISEIFVINYYVNYCRLQNTECQIMYKWILNKREYLGPDWPTDVWPADDIAFCSIFTYIQYWRMYDLALSNTIKMTHIVWFWLTWSIKTNRTIVRTTLYEYALCKDLPQQGGSRQYLNSTFSVLFYMYRLHITENVNLK